ncbi:CRISPR-associated endonuclease Cas1 [uncultured Thiohalocapsa sp.]|uniref:CRISPR-associated endonuclease Cas1 n=1 Tax=uncultured Thiohalocapsa sp. TaxID=768990 RepID=UPI0025CBBF87|nr:CRISPR-associated endonuclease Cas1 [uncultured Thiohalocapsa sp.]
METLFVTREARLKQRENTLSITIGERTRSIPIESIGHLVLLGEAQLNSRLLILCGKHGVRVSVFDYYGYCKGAFEPIENNPAGLVKLKQAELLLDDKRRMAVAREVVRGAAHNMLANLRYYRYRGAESLAAIIAGMQKLVPKIGPAQTTAVLMGIEGNLHEWYYSGWKHIDLALDFTPRVRRPPNNPVNCLISFLNQLTYAVTRHEASKTHLEPAFSVLHAPGHRRASLGLDLCEPFKPVIVDMLIFRMARRRMLADNWFELQDGVCLLTETGRRYVSEQFSQRLEEAYSGRTYREWIYREALGIERHVLGVAEYAAFKRKA